MFCEYEYSFYLGLILSAMHFKWSFCTTYLRASHPPSGVTPSSILHKLALSLHLFAFYSFWFFLAPFPFVFKFLFIFFSFGLSILYILNSVPLHHLHLIIVFSLCPLEVNLHTYLTSWLSSCLVEIFFGFLTIIVNLKNLNQK